MKKNGASANNAVDVFFFSPYQYTHARFILMDSSHLLGKKI